MRKILTLMLIAPSLSGCVFAVRHAAIAANRSETEQKLRREFPIGTAHDAIRTAIEKRGYVCTNAPSGDEAFDLRCDPAKRSFAPLGGNWHLSFLGRDGKLTSLHVSKRAQRSAPHIDH